MNPSKESTINRDSSCQSNVFVPLCNGVFVDVFADNAVHPQCDRLAPVHALHVQEAHEEESSANNRNPPNVSPTEVCSLSSDHSFCNRSCEVSSDFPIPLGPTAATFAGVLNDTYVEDHRDSQVPRVVSVDSPLYNKAVSGGKVVASTSDAAASKNTFCDAGCFPSEMNGDNCAVSVSEISVTTGYRTISSSSRTRISRSRFRECGRYRNKSKGIHANQSNGRGRSPTPDRRRREGVTSNSRYNMETSRFSRNSFRNNRDSRSRSPSRCGSSYSRSDDKSIKSNRRDTREMRYHRSYRRDLSPHSFRTTDMSNRDRSSGRRNKSSDCIRGRRVKCDSRVRRSISPNSHPSSHCAITRPPLCPTVIADCISDANKSSRLSCSADIVDDAIDDVVDDDASAALSAHVSAIASPGAPSIVAVVSSQSDVYRKVGNGDGIAASGGRKRQRSDSAEHDRCDYHHYSYRRNLCSRSSSSRRRFHTDLPLEWWDRAEDCKEAKARHTARIDHICESREQLVLKTTLWKEDTVLEPNMFPYWTPRGVEHYTLWSIHDLNHSEIVSFVDKWLSKRMPRVRRWQYDDNSGERSIDLFHVHVFIETAPFSFTPREGMQYFPPHVQLPQDNTIV